MICGVAAQWPAFVRGRCIALFAPLPTEPDIRPLIEEAWAHGKRVVLPLMRKSGATPELDWHEIAGWENVIVPGPFGLHEPDPLNCPLVPLAEIDCAFIPGVAFDETGLRLGRGGGYYDSFLAQAGTALPAAGLMFACQQVKVLPREPHDCALGSVITEDGGLSFGR